MTPPRPECSLFVIVSNLARWRRHKHFRLRTGAGGSAYNLLRHRNRGTRSGMPSGEMVLSSASHLSFSGIIKSWGGWRRGAGRRGRYSVEGEWEDVRNAPGGRGGERRGGGGENRQREKRRREEEKSSWQSDGGSQESCSSFWPSSPGLVHKGSRSLLPSHPPSSPPLPSPTTTSALPPSLPLPPCPTFT